MRRHTLRTLLPVAAVALGLAPVAIAAWAAAGAGAAAARARTLPASALPAPTTTLSANGKKVTVQWTAAAFVEGGAVGTYVVKRYAAGGGLVAIRAACNGLVSGLSCTENNTPAGVWRYTVTPAAGAWSGSESPPSAALAVP